MNCRLKRLLLFVSSMVMAISISVKADPFIDENQEDNVVENDLVEREDSKAEAERSFYEELYYGIIDGESVIDINVKEDGGLRANIPVEEKPVVPSVSDVNKKTSSNIGNKIADYARSLVGKPYVFGATGPNSFDCSGFVLHVYKKFGINLPRTSQSQANYGKRVSRSDLRPGDLIFSNTYSSLSHVGVYIGDGQFVHSANTRTGVTISGVNDSYYGPRYAWATRPY